MCSVIFKFFNGDYYKYIWLDSIWRRQSKFNGGNYTYCIKLHIVNFVQVRYLYGENFPPHGIQGLWLGICIGGMRFAVKSIYTHETIYNFIKNKCIYDVSNNVKLYLYNVIVIAMEVLCGVKWEVCNIQKLLFSLFLKHFFDCSNVS